MKGAKARVIIYSLVETAKKNHLNPISYFTYEFEQLPLIDVNNEIDLDQLMPWSENIPQNCHVPIKAK